MFCRGFVARALRCVPLALVAGCQLLGPSSLREGRINYNKAIQDTQKIEVFSNFIRISHQEPTLFLSVAEIDASGTVQTSVSPQVSNIGVGMKPGDQLAGPSATYTEQPIIKYVPLSGQELVAQIATPITPQSLTDLLDSDWNLVPVLELTVDRMTPQFVDQGAALNAIAQLNDYRALVLTSVPAGLRLYVRPEKPSIAPVLDETEQIGAGSTDVSETIARRNILHMWIRLLRIYENTQTAKSAKCPITTIGDPCLDALDKSAERLSDSALDAAFAALPAYIDLCNTPQAEAADLPSGLGAVRALVQTGGTVTLDSKSLDKLLGNSSPNGTPDVTSTRGSATLVDRGPILHMRSALGVLKAIVRAGGTVREFKMDVPGQPEALETALQKAVSERHTCLVWPNFYVFAPSVVASSQGPDYTADQNAVSAKVAGQKCVSQTLAPDSTLDVHDFRALRRELMLFASRAFILYESSPDEPNDAYVSYYDDGRWYYISKKDGISKQNLLLLAQLLTMQAVPSKNETTPVALSLQ